MCGGISNWSRMGSRKLFEPARIGRFCVADCVGKFLATTGPESERGRTESGRCRLAFIEKTVYGMIVSEKNSIGTLCK